MYFPRVYACDLYKYFLFDPVSAAELTGSWIDGRRFPYKKFIDLNIQRF